MNASGKGSFVRHWRQHGPMPSVRGWLGEWDTFHRATVVGLPTDVTYRLTKPPRARCSYIWRGWTCSRLPGHKGRCAAGDGNVIRAVWVKS